MLLFVEGCKLDDSSVNYLIKETVLVLSVMPKISKGRVEHLILCSLVNFVKTWREKTVLISQKSCVSSLVMPITNLIGTYIGILYNTFVEKVNQWKSKLAFVFFHKSNGFIYWSGVWYFGTDVRYVITYLWLTYNSPV